MSHSHGQSVIFHPKNSVEHSSYFVYYPWWSHFRRTSCGEFIASYMSFEIAAEIVHIYATSVISFMRTMGNFCPWSILLSCLSSLLYVLFRSFVLMGYDTSFHVSTTIPILCCKYRYLQSLSEVWNQGIPHKSKMCTSWQTYNQSITNNVGDSYLVIQWRKIIAELRIKIYFTTIEISNNFFWSLAQI